MNGGHKLSRSQRPIASLHHLLFDGAEEGSVGRIKHLDAHRIAERQERGLGTPLSRASIMRTSARQKELAVRSTTSPPRAGLRWWMRTASPIFPDWRYLNLG